jgi:DNA-binding MarR family transcriptional regulator
MEKILEEISEKLDIIISLMIPPFSEEKYDLKGDTQLAVLKLCDLNHTQKDISKKLGKTKKSIERAIQKLMAANLIKSVHKDNEVVYLRLK